MVTRSRWEGPIASERSADADVTGAARLAARPGVFATASFTVFLAIVVAFHFVQPDLHPFQRVVSEYAVGRLGWLLNAGFGFFAFGLAALAMAFGWLLGPPARARLGGVLLGVSALGILANAIFTADLQGADVTAQGIAHHLAGFVAFFSLIPGAILISRRLARADRLHGRYRRLGLLAWLLIPLCLAMLLVFARFDAIGLGQRIFLGGVFAWLLLAAHGLRAGAFARDDVRTSTETFVAEGT